MNQPLGTCTVGRMLTASTAKCCYSYGKRLNSNQSSHFGVLIMKKIDEEGNARDKYSEREGVEVQNSGLWINRKYPHLAASPDGLLPDGGIIEIKCLKIFRETSICEVLSHPKHPKLADQCFLADGQNLHLKRYHPYYFQVQLQLLVTGAPYW